MKNKEYSQLISNKEIRKDYKYFIILDGWIKKIKEYEANEKKTLGEKDVDS